MSSSSLFWKWLTVNAFSISLKNSCFAASSTFLYITEWSRSILFFDCEVQHGWIWLVILIATNKSLNFLKYFEVCVSLVCRMFIFFSSLLLLNFLVKQIPSLQEALSERHISLLPWYFQWLPKSFTFVLVLHEGHRFWHLSVGCYVPLNATPISLFFFWLQESCVVYMAITLCD